LSDVLAHPAIKTIYVLEGTLNVQLTDEESWIEAHAEDGVYLPAGTRHRFLNFTTQPVRLLFQLVPESGSVNP
jgi:quercetin dioxygenase-like cupin family protein